MREKFVEVQTRILISSFPFLYVCQVYWIFFPGRDLQLGILSQKNSKDLARCLSRQLMLSAAWLASCIMLEFGLQEYNQADLVT